MCPGILYRQSSESPHDTIKLAHEMLDCLLMNSLWFMINNGLDLCVWIAMMKINMYNVDTIF